MTLDPKIILILTILLFNLIFLASQKGRIVACFNVAIMVCLLILLLSFVATNQELFKNIAFLLMAFLVVCVFVIASQGKVDQGKKEVKRNVFSFGYFLLVTIFTVGVFISVSFLLTSTSVDIGGINKVEVIKKIDVNNSRLAKKKHESKTSLFDEKDLAIKLFKGFSDVIILGVIALSLGNLLAQPSTNIRGLTNKQPRNKVI